MYNVAQYEILIKERLSEYRYYHSMCVAKRAVQLAEKYHQNTEKAYIAGVLHDVTKEESVEKQKELILSDGITVSDVENKVNNVLHQMSGAVFVKNKLEITDNDIVSGIRYHTTGKANMTVFETITYLADFTSEDRKYPDVEIMRQKTDTSLIDGLYYSLRYTISSLTQKGVLIHPDTINCYNWVLEQMK